MERTERTQERTHPLPGAVFRVIVKQNEKNKYTNLLLLAKKQRGVFDESELFLQ